MSGTDMLVGLIVVIIVGAIYFFTQKSDKNKLSVMSTPAVSRSPVIDRLAGDHTNLAPGTPVPMSGYYECIICGAGGLVDNMAVALYGEAEAHRRAMTRKSTMQFFNQNSIFPTCPNCGDGAGWSRLKE